MASGQRLENQNLKLFLKFGSSPIPRVGISISSSVFKQAVERNRARRLVSTGFENLYQQLPANLNIIAMPKLNCFELSSNEIKIDLEQLLKKGQVL